MQVGGERALSDLVGATLDGKYRLDGVLGRGGMGVVYQATHLGTRRTVALKVIAPRFLSEPEFVERFRREAEAAGRLRHPNVVDVTDFGFGEADHGFRRRAEPVVGPGAASRTDAPPLPAPDDVRLAYLVMEFLDGCTLDEILHEEGRLPLRWVADVLDQACSAVAEAHKRGIVHRDLKPSNLWLEPDRRGGYTVKVLDFGLARLGDPGLVATAPAAPSASVESREAVEEAETRVRPEGLAGRDAGVQARADEAETRVRAELTEPADEADTRIRPDSTEGVDATDTPHLTRLGTTLGTPAYMSPEQWRGEPAGAASDVYSLGVIAWQLLAGRVPYAGSTTELRRLHLESAPPPLPREVPASLEALVRQALSKDPAARPVSAAAFGASFAARAENAGATLRQVVGLLIEQPRLFFGVPVAALLPCLLWLLLGSLLAGRAQSPPARVAMSMAVGLPALLLFFAGLQAASALLLPVVAQMLAMPLRPVVLRPLVAALGQRFREFARLVANFFWGYVRWVLLPTAVAAAFVGAVVLSRVPRAWRGPALIATFFPTWATAAVWLVRLGDLGFAAAAILMEGLDTAAALARSRALAQAARRDLQGFERVRGLLLLTGVTAGLGAGFVVARLLGDDEGVRMGLAGRALLAIVVCAGLAVLFALFLAISALQYFKARQAAGEPLFEVLAQFERLALPAGYWQQRVRERVRLEVEQSRR